MAIEGFRRDPNGPGLFVPEHHSRARMVLTKDETKTLNRCVEKVLGAYEMKFELRCNHIGCPEPQIVRIKEPGRYILRCGHADRILETAF